MRTEFSLLLFLVALSIFAQFMGTAGNLFNLSPKELRAKQDKLNVWRNISKASGIAALVLGLVMLYKHETEGTYKVF